MVISPLSAVRDRTIIIKKTKVFGDGFLGSLTLDSFYGRYHGLDDHAIYQWRPMVLRLEGRHGHQLGPGHCFLGRCTLRLALCHF